MHKSIPASSNIDKTGGLPQNVRTRAIQDYSIRTRRKSRPNPGRGERTATNKRTMGY